MIKNTLIFIFLSFVSLQSTFSYAAIPQFVAGQPMPSLAPMLERSMPAVVNISTTSNLQIREHPLLSDPFFRYYFRAPNQPQRKQKNSLGSGVIIDSQAGLVITNNHVIAKADEITVTLHDGRQLQAELVGTDPEADIAVIRIPDDNLTELKIANSRELKVGDFVVAIGNPFGLGQTVTSGIVSALGRSGLGIEGYEDFIQTDASINPGNSGGALVNLNGELIGINTAILAPSGGNVGIGFAIPSNMAMNIMESLVKHGEVRRGRLGVTTQDLTPDLMKAFNLSNKNGAVVNRVQEGSAADIAGLQPGDIIISSNGRKVTNSHGLRNAIGLLKIGDLVALNVLRGDKEHTITATIGKPKRLLIKGDKLHRRLQGTQLTSSPRNQVEGVVFESIETDSYAWHTGLRPGDIIVSANRYRVRSTEALSKVINPRRDLLINIQRGGEAFFVVLKH